MFYLKQNSSESLLLYDHMEIKPFGLHQLQDVRNEPADVQQLFVIKEEFSGNSSLKQQSPGSLQIKEEEEELGISQEGKRFYGQKEADGSRFNESVKSEENEEKPQLSQLHQIKIEDNRETEAPTCSSATQMKKEPDGEDCKVPEPRRNPSPESHSQPHLDEKAKETSGDDDDDDMNAVSLDSECENADSDNDWRPISVTIPTKRSFGCSECGKQLRSKHSLQKHKMLHLEKDSSNSQVDGRFREKPNSNPRKKSHTRKKRFPCTDCGKNFRYKSRLTDHMLSHTEEKLFSCTDCGNKFRRERDLKYHMWIHNGEKQFSCSDCGKKFRYNSQLKDHMSIHTGEKPFSCRDCGTKFRLKRQLKYHMWSHTGEKPFPCSDCGKDFRTKKGLQYHMRIHAEEKPFPCSDCGKKFRSKSHLNRHTVIHTGKKTCF